MFMTKLLNNKPPTIANLTDKEFDTEMLKAENDFENGRVYSIEEVEEELRKVLEQ